MPHQTLSTRNDYEQKINYDWPKNALIYIKLDSNSGHKLTIKVPIK